VVYEVLIERSAERDLKSLPTVIYNRIVPRIRHWRIPHVLQAAINWPVPKTTGEFGSVIIESSTKLMMPANS